MENKAEQKEVATEQQTTAVEVLNTAPQTQAIDAVVVSGKEAFEHSLRIAKMLATSNLVPKDYQNNVANCTIALEMANRIGATPLMVMQNLYIVHGRPAWSSSFLIATFNASKKFTTLNFEHDEKKGGGACRAFAVEVATGERFNGTWITKTMVDGEGWSKKTGSKWITMPEQMFMYRAAAFFIRMFAPEISMGIMTQDEAHDISGQNKVETKWSQAPE